MSDPTLLYCVGATKAGTSWLYRHLHDHPSCTLPAVKEAHYWDTFEPEARDKQIAAFQVRLRDLRKLKAEAQDAGRGWQVRNVNRRIASMQKLIAVVAGDRTDDLAYAAWLMEGAESARLVADMTPNYAILPDEMFSRMVDLSPTSKFVYLMRDPIERLWSHVRMQARRYLQAGEDYAKKANNILWRVVNNGGETHMMARGDYPATITKLRRVVPEGRLLVAFAEELFTPDGLRKMSAFLGIDYLPVEERKVHAGEHVPMRDELRPKVAAFLQEQYDWVAMNVGPLPVRWQDNLKRAMA